MHSSWGTLLQRYFISQGLVLNQHIAVVSEMNDASVLVNGCMWLPPSRETANGTNASQSNNANDDEDEEISGSDAKIKIAWRYEKMQQFQTTVASSSSLCMELLPRPKYKLSLS